MSQWRSDEELFVLLRAELFTAVVGDVMDTLGLQHQFLPAAIRPLRQEMVVVGRAMPVLEADVWGEPGAAVGDTVVGHKFGLMFNALDDLKPGEVYLCTGGSLRYALWGELMTTRALRLGAAGVVLDGYYRDSHGIARLGFPTFGRGSYAQDQGPRGKVIDYRVAVEIEGVRLRPGDLVFGDVDGVCVVPREAEAEIVQQAVEKVRGENMVRQAIEDGMSAAEAFRTFGIM